MLYPVLESRTKEAMWMGDLDLAAERARSLIQLSPQDPRASLHYGEVLLERGEVEQALRAYCDSARFSPPGREIAMFMAGQCYEELGDLESACDAYVAALETDPLGISTAERLEAVADRMGCAALLEWVRSLLAGLRELQEHARPQRGEPYKNLPAPLESQPSEEFVSPN
jgi:tetratricopeptide (TPR) repeat protein